MTPGTYPIPQHRSGDTWKGISSLTIKINGEAPSVSLASVKIQFRKNAGTSVVLELSTEDGTIVILDAINWTIQIPKIIVTLYPDTYIYDIQTVDSNGDIFTYVVGTWEIIEDITR